MIKRILWVLLLASGLQTSWGFSLGGPIGNGGPTGDSWQTPTIGYGLASDLNAPKNLGEEYRRNTPVMYYTFDQSFFDYFREHGVTSLDNAFAILNSLTNVDNYSKLLSEFPVESRSQNYQAQALGLLDLKSFTLGAMIEQLGLTDPVRYSWTLHDRWLPPGGACPIDEEYLVVQRNFDFFSPSLNQLPYSPYVNNTLYDYFITEICSGPNPLAVTVPYSVDPLADIYSPVASSIAIFWGDYYTGLTRDDAAGLRYLLSTNNINWETPASDALTIVTNTLNPALFPVLTTTNGGYLFNGVAYGTASYGALYSYSQTNNAAAVQAAFPGVQLTQTGNYFTNVIVTNIVSYFTNYYGEAIGTPPHLVTKTVLTPTIVEYYKYTFDNIITNIYSATTVIKTQTITVAPANGAPIGSPSVTNVTTKTSTVKIPNGEFYILPTNSPCGLDIANTLVTFTNYSTNILTAASTNTANATTNSTFAYSQIQVVPNISHVYVINPVTCDVTNAITGLYEGIGNIKFVRADFDSMIGQNWKPVTNDYSMVLVTNSQTVIQHFRRIVTQPDFLFSAYDQTGPNPPSPNGNNNVYIRDLTFDQDNILVNQGGSEAGPGTIITPTHLAFNKDGPVYFNTPLDTIDGTAYFNQTPGGDQNNLFYAFAPYFVWASFDGTTNAPIVFPNTIGIDDLANQILIHISPTTLPLGIGDGQHPYPATTFTTTGGSFTQPYTWSSSDSFSGLGTGLPSGMSLSPDGTLSGTPTQSGTFDFNLTLTDYVGRTVQWVYTITIQ